MLTGNVICVDVMVSVFHNVPNRSHLPNKCELLGRGISLDSSQCKIILANSMRRSGVKKLVISGLGYGSNM